MLGIALLAFTFAYGRISKSFSLRSLAILAVIALSFTYLSALLLHVPFDARLLISGGAQFVFQLIVFVLGALLGRWLDRNKDAG
jgi:hypothetical protein